MAWARLHDRANGCAKLLALSDGAWRLWGNALIYCQFNLTDGFIPVHVPATLGVRARPLGRLVTELCQISVPGKGPLWHEVEGGYQVHDYLNWNPSRAEVLAAREAADEQRAQGRSRMERYRQRLTGDPLGGDASRDGEQNAGCADVGGPRDASRDGERDAPPLSPPAPPYTPPGSTSTKNTHTARARGQSLLAGTLPRDHVGCAWCGRVCVPAFLHAQFRRALGGPDDVAEARLRAWYDQAIAAIPEAEPVEPDALKFWRPRFAAAFPAAAAKTPRKSASGTSRTGSAGAEAYDQVMLGTAKGGSQ